MGPITRRMRQREAFETLAARDRDIRYRPAEPSGGPWCIRSDHRHASLEDAARCASGPAWLARLTARDETGAILGGATL